MDTSDIAAIDASLTEPQCFLPIFERHYEPIVRYLRRRLPAADADDVAAEVFLTAFRRRSSFDRRRGDMRTWLFGIATNLVRNHKRSERRRLLLLNVAERPAETDHGVESNVSLFSQALGESLAALAQSERDVLFLFACADLSYEEIAAALDIPIGTVRSRLNRARSTVRTALRAVPVANEEVRFG